VAIQVPRLSDNASGAVSSAAPASSTTRARPDRARPSASATTMPKPTTTAMPMMSSAPNVPYGRIGWPPKDAPVRVTNCHAPTAPSTTLTPRTAAHTTARSRRSCTAAATATGMSTNNSAYRTRPVTLSGMSRAVRVASVSASSTAANGTQPRRTSG
jgi:hypothetical protein